MKTLMAVVTPGSFTETLDKLPSSEVTVVHRMTGFQDRPSFWINFSVSRERFDRIAAENCATPESPLSLGENLGNDLLYLEEWVGESDHLRQNLHHKIILSTPSLEVAA